MYNISPEYRPKLKIKYKSRPVSNLDKKIQYPSNSSNNTFRYRPKKILDITFNKDNNNNNKDLKPKKRSYLNLSQKAFKNQSYNKALIQKKLFYNKIYDKKYGNNDILGLSEYFNIKNTSKNNFNKKNEYSLSGIS